MKDYAGAQSFYGNQVIPLFTLNPMATVTTGPALCCWTLESIRKVVQGLGSHFSALASASYLLVEKAMEQIESVGTGLSIIHK